MSTSNIDKAYVIVLILQRDIHDYLNNNYLFVIKYRNYV